MQNFVFFLLTVLFLTFLLRSLYRAGTVAVKLSAGPDPVKVALLHRDGLAMALQAVENLDESPEQKAIRREKLLLKQRNFQLGNQS